MRSHTAHNIFELDGEVPRFAVSGDTPEISPFCKFSSYNWLYFRDTTPNSPNDKMMLGRYLGPSADEGPEMSAKILKHNGQVVARSIYCGLTQEYIIGHDEIKARDKFDKEVKFKFSEPCVTTNFESNPEAMTPTHELYGDDEEEHICESAPDADNVTSEMFDKYIGAEFFYHAVMQ